MAHTGGNYTLRFYSNATLLNEVTLAVPSATKFIRTVKKTLSAYLLFESCILVVSMSSALSQINSVALPSGLPTGTVLSMDAYGSILVYAYQSSISILNCSN